MVVREVEPRDFYWFALVENDFPDLDPTTLTVLIIQMLTGCTEGDLQNLPQKSLPPLSWWIMDNIVKERVMKVDGWLEMAFHLQKQRWDDSIDWLETQPMSKILLMNRIQGGFVEEQNRQMKKKK